MSVQEPKRAIAGKGQVGRKAPPRNAMFPAATPAPVARVQGLTTVLVVLAGMGSLYLVSPASFMVLLTGLAPTVAAAFFETGRSRNVVGCMAALNLAGVAPVMGLLWTRGNTMGAAAQLLRDPYMWLLMYGAAALALALLWVAPLVAQMVIEANAGHERARLLQAQEALIEEWGQAVSGAPEVDPEAEEEEVEEVG